MRTSTLFTGAALAATAFAGPLLKRDLEIDTVYDVTYETVYVTETEGATVAAVATSTVAAVESAPATTSSIAAVQHYGHRHSWGNAASSSSAVSSAASSVAPVASTSSVETKVAVDGGYTSAWTSSWASTIVVSSSAAAEPTTSAVATSSAASAASTEVSLLKSFHHLLSRDSLHPRVNFESLMAQMFHPASSSQVKRATTTVKITSTVKAPVTTKKTTSSSKKTSSTSKKVSTTKKATTSTVVKKATTTSKPKTSSSTKKTSTTKKASQTTSAATGKATTYQQRVIAHHNVHRANHSASALTWDDDLASTAATIAKTCVYAHSMNVNGGGYGQNIAAGVEASNISAVISDLFYNGEVNYFDGLYGQANPDMSNFENWGHFSQIVWKGTTKVGCATQYCSGGLQNAGPYVSPYFTVCNYGSPGNYAGEYADNVGKSLGKATQDWSYDL